MVSRRFSEAASEYFGAAETGKWRKLPNNEVRLRTVEFSVSEVTERGM